MDSKSLQDIAASALIEQVCSESKSLQAIAAFAQEILRISSKHESLQDIVVTAQELLRRSSEPKSKQDTAVSTQEVGRLRSRSDAMADSASRAPILKLPAETLCHIATYIESDEDFTAYLAVCARRVGCPIDKTASVWRDRYAQRYDLPPDLSLCEVRQGYRFLARRGNWQAVVEDRNEQQATITTNSPVPVMMKLINESFSNGGPTSKNLVALKKLWHEYMLADDIFHPSFFRAQQPFDPLQRDTQAVQLTLLHEIFNPVLPNPVAWSRSLSQHYCFAYPEKYQMVPCRKTGTIDFTVALHIVNLFKHHLNDPNDYLGAYYHNLDKSERPKPWDKILEREIFHLGRKWKGTAAFHQDFLDTLACRMKTNYDDSPVFESFDGRDDGFHEMRLDYTEEFQPKWTENFNYYSDSIPPPQERRVRTEDNRKKRVKVEPVTGRDYAPFVGELEDGGSSLVAGNHHPLPDQCSIPGWHRISCKRRAPTLPPNIPILALPPYRAFTPYSPAPQAQANHAATPPVIQYPRPASAGTYVPDPPPAQGRAHAEHAHLPPRDLDAVDLEDAAAPCFAYEGVVVPGGKVMVGRWWATAEEAWDDDAPEVEDPTIYAGRLCGPFIYWCVD